MIQLLLPVFFICLVGFFNLFGVNQQIGLQQLIYYFLGFLVYFIGRKINKRFFFENNQFFYWFFIFILIITYILGYEAKGSTRWLDFYFFKFQPSEFLKIFFIVFFASFFTRVEKKLNQRLNFVKAIFYFSIPFLLIFKQPDLGNALVYGYIFLVMFIFSPIPKKYFFYLGILFLLISPLLWRILKPYQQQRIISFIKPTESYHSSSYHMTQSIITVGSGMFFGRGLGFGTQTKLLFLPESTTDFAFASLIEQFGFFLGFLTIILYLYLIIQILNTAFIKNIHFDQEKENFYYCVGFASFLFFQALVNIGMSLGILPIAGITLPLISYGGSSILTLMFGLSLL